jgi:dolichol-phosphate mannosyltransferase
MGLSMSKRAVVVIPTYNEAGSIGKILRHLTTQTLSACAPWDVHILVVDGCSTDGTTCIAREASQIASNVHLLVEEKKSGIGAAYLRGFEYAVKELSAEVLIEFDGDFQHPPEAIPELLREIDKGADLVLGSRRIRGGSYPPGWGFYRRFLSQIGGSVARLVLFFPKSSFWRVTDPTSGLKATRVKGVYDSIDIGRVTSTGFAYKVEMLFECMRSTVKVREIPLQFGVRLDGQSKITGQTPKEILYSVFRLRWNDEATRRFFRFGLVGFTGFLINATVLEALGTSRLLGRLATYIARLGLPPLLSFMEQRSSWAAGIGAECSIISNYLLNNTWTFAKYRARGAASFLSSGLKFNLTSIGAVCIQFIIVGGATLLFGETPIVRQTSLVLAILFVVIPYNWLIYNKVIWRTPTD